METMIKKRIKTDISFRVKDKTENDNHEVTL